VLYSTSDQVLEKAEETRKSVKFRMAILEIEHHLNRLYPQIGKLTCDLAEKGAKDWQKDKNLKTKIDLAEEYRQRLDELKKNLTEHQQKSREEPG
jgi:predicted DNA-binding protein